MDNKFAPIDMDGHHINLFQEQTRQSLLANSAIEASLRKANQENRKRHDAIVNTAKNTESINREVQGIFVELSKEISDRKLADQENKKYSQTLDAENLQYTKKSFRWSLAFGVLGFLVAVASLIVSILK